MDVAVAGVSVLAIVAEYVDGDVVVAGDVVVFVVDDEDGVLVMFETEAGSAPGVEDL